MALNMDMLTRLMHAKRAAFSPWQDKVFLQTLAGCMRSWRTRIFEQRYARNDITLEACT